MNSIIRLFNEVNTRYSTTVKFQVSPELITLQRIITLPDDTKVIGRETSVHLDTMRARPEWKDGCSWHFRISDDITGSNIPKPSNDRVIMYNCTAETFASKRLSGNYMTMQNAFFTQGIMHVPFADADFTEMSYHLLLADPGVVYESNLEFSELEKGVNVIDFQDNRRFPNMTIDAPDTITHDKYVQGKVQVLWQGKPLSGHTVEVCLDALAGYLPKTRLVVGSEPESFRIGALGLQAGDKILLRAGFKYRSSMAEKLITVV